MWKFLLSSKGFEYYFGPPTLGNLYEEEEPHNIRFKDYQELHLGELNETETLHLKCLYTNSHAPNTNASHIWRYAN